MIGMGIVRKEWPLTPRDSVAPAWDSLGEDRKRDLDLRMAIYAAQVDRMDHNIGRVVQRLRQLGRLDNTLILFLADNGGCAEGGPFGFDRGEGPLGTADSYSSYGLGWANASNTPFRRYKHWVHEGGIATPLIAHWPAVIKARGTLSDQPGHIIDLMATCLDVAGAKYPREFGGHEITPLEGKSLLPILEGKKRKGHEAIFWEHEGNRAVRAGDWKLVSRFPGKWELYNLQEDRTELHDLAAEHPRKVRELEALYKQWAERSQVLPWPVRTPPSSGRREFVLKVGDRLEGGEVPNIAETALRVSASVTATGDGVIVAQGGSQAGFALSVEDGRPAFTVRSWQATTTIRSGQSILGRKVTLRAQLDENGAMTLWIDDEKTAKGSAPILIHTVPGEGLFVGRDPGNPVGAYAAPSAFAGTIHEVRLTLLP
ncbi:sulfatase-like hydrolase/transferase [bacterium]|nr:sulfatase-like hydrolase/transferase [bacterium]